MADKPAKPPSSAGDNVSLRDYWDMLNGHDWYYQYSDDHRWWSAGSANQRKIEGLAKQSPRHQKLFEQFNKHVFTGAPWGTVQAPKPPRPRR